MRIALLLLLTAAPCYAAKDSALICFYNQREHVAKMTTAFCSQGVFMIPEFDVGKNVSCGITNTLDRMFGNLCEDPCASVIKGIKGYSTKDRGFKNVAIGPALLPTDADSKFAFAAYDGSCSGLLDTKNPPLDGLTEEQVIRVGGSQ